MIQPFGCTNTRPHPAPLTSKSNPLPLNATLLWPQEISCCQSRLAARWASHISEYKIFQIELSRGYGPNEFHEDLKKMLSNAGVKAAPTVFLFSDTQIVKESFLEDINNVLNAGEVPDLFGKDEVDGIVESVRKKAKEAGKPQTRDGIYSYFVQLCRENLHVCLTMSPVGDAFRTRLRMFPSLVNCCTIDWYTEWPEDAPVGVATRFLQGVDLGSEEMLTNVAKMCSVIHASVSATSKRFLSELRRYNYTTPTSYLELISMYAERGQRKSHFQHPKIPRWS